MWTECQEIAASVAAQLGEDRLAGMTDGAIAAHIRRDMPGESFQVRSNVAEALAIIRDDIRR